VEAAVMERWDTYLSENESQIKPLINEYLELKMHLEPPPKEEIQDWASRALPVFGSLRSQLEEGVDDLRDIADPDQRVKIDMQSMMLQGALNMTQGQLELWEEGKFVPEDFIEPTAAERRAQRAEWRKKREAEREAKALADAQADAAKAEQAAAEQQDTPKDYIAEEMTLWERYVADFVKQYTLDEGQRSSAWSVLQELQGRARRYRSLRRNELARLEEVLATPAAIDRTTDVEDRIRDLYGPVDEMFTELKNRIERIPTPRQRADAEQRAADEAERKETESQKPPEKSETSQSDESGTEPE
ncbi:MAG: hypothetical protein ACPGXK_07470, partial [Phycisphaerae bacterium]